MSGAMERTWSDGSGAPARSRIFNHSTPLTCSLLRRVLCNRKRHGLPNAFLRVPIVPACVLACLPEKLLINVPEYQLMLIIYDPP